MRAEFSQPARGGENGPGRYVAGLPIVLFSWLVLGTVFYAAPMVLTRGDGNPATYLDARTAEVVGYPVVGFAAFMLSFLMLWAGLYVAIRFVHERPFATLVNPAGRVDRRRLAEGFGLFLALSAAAFSATYLLDPSGFKVALEPGRFLPFLLVALALVPIQTSAEELLFRGYLLQGFGLLTNNALALSAISGLLFVLPHMPSPEVPGFGGGGFLAAALNYFVFGFFLALVTLKDGGLELALGAHAANNLFAFLMVNSEDYQLGTPSVFWVTSEPKYAQELVGTVVVMAAFYLLTSRVTKRRGAGGATGTAGGASGRA